MSQSIKSWLLPVAFVTFQNRIHFFCRTVSSKGHIISGKATVVLPEITSLWSINYWGKNASDWALKILPSRTQYNVKSSLQSIYWMIIIHTYIQWMIIILFAALTSNYRGICRQSMMSQPQSSGVDSCGLNPQIFLPSGEWSGLSTLSGVRWESDHK